MSFISRKETGTMECIKTKIHANLGIWGGVILLLLLLTSCYQYVYIPLPSGSDDHTIPHTHNWILRDYVIGKAELDFKYECDICGKTKTESESCNVITASQDNIESEIKNKNNIFVAVTPDTVQDVLNSVGSNCTILLSSGNYTNGIKICARENSDDSSVKDLTIIGSANSQIGPGMDKGIQFQADSSRVLNIDGINFINIIFNESKGFPNSWGVTGSNSKINDVNYIGCTFIGNNSMNDNDTNIAINPHAEGHLKFSNFTIENCTFEKYYEIFYCSNIENLTVKNCDIKDSMYGINVNGNNNSGKFIFDNNTFTNMSSNPFAMFNLANAEITITNNNFNGEQVNSIVYIHNNTGENVHITANSNMYNGSPMAEVSGDISNMTEDYFALRKDLTIHGSVN